MVVFLMNLLGKLKRFSQSIAPHSMLLPQQEVLKFMKYFFKSVILKGWTPAFIQRQGTVCPQRPPRTALWRPPGALGT
jgi:hypothetical protein